jgi:hypothetical protein
MFMSDILFELQRISTQFQFLRSENRPYLSSKRWLKEFCTIRLCGPRQSGHSLAAAELIAATEGDVWYISNNHQICECFKENYPKATPKNGKLYTFGAYSVESATLGLSIPSLVIVDCASFMNKTTEDALYDLLSIRNIPTPFHVVFLE